MGAMLFNREGRRVIVHPALYQWYLDVQGYQKITYVMRGRTRGTNRVAVVREVGGLGDVICVQSAVAGLMDLGLDVTLYTPRKFWPVCIAPHLEDTTDRLPPLGSAADFDRTYNMFCPAGDYEATSGMRPVKGRVRNFCETSGVVPRTPPIAHLVGPPLRLNSGLHIGLQPISENPSKDLSPNQVRQVADLLRARGATCHVFHDRPIEVPGCELHIRRPLEEVARRIAGLDAMVAVDSGLLHLAACFDVPTVGIFGPTNGPITCEFYPSVSVVQAGQPSMHNCFAPCYYAQKPNRYICRKQQGICIEELNVAVIAAEALHRATGGATRHHIPRHWLELNLETELHHGEVV